MSDRVRMTSLSTYQNDRMVVFREGGPEGGEKGIPVTPGDEFETDPWHARELARNGLAAALEPAALDGELPPLEAHHQVSVAEIRADQVARAAAVDPALAVDAVALRQRAKKIV